jgi:hypothetical protein
MALAPNVAARQHNRPGTTIHRPRRTPRSRHRRERCDAWVIVQTPYARLGLGFWFVVTICIPAEANTMGMSRANSRLYSATLLGSLSKGTKLGFAQGVAPSLALVHPAVMFGFSKKREFLGGETRNRRHPSRVVARSHSRCHVTPPRCGVPWHDSTP